MIVIEIIFSVAKIIYHATTIVIAILVLKTVLQHEYLLVKLKGVIMSVKDDLATALQKLDEQKALIISEHEQITQAVATQTATIQELRDALEAANVDLAPLLTKLDENNSAITGIFEPAP